MLTKESYNRQFEGDRLPPFDLGTAWRAVYRGKWFLLEIMAVSIVCALIYIHLQAPLYTATAIIAPQDNSQATMQSGSSALQALSSLSGLDMSKNGSMDEFTQLLDTPLVAARMQRQYGALSKLFHGSWDAKAHRWKTPSGVRFRVHNFINGILGARAQAHPDEFSLAGYISKYVIVTKVRSSNLITLQYSSDTPEFSIYFLNIVCAAADETMRDAVKKRAALNVQFLQDKLQTVESSDLRQAFIMLVEGQEKALMLASSGDTYAFRFVQPPSASDQPSWPAPNKILMVSLLLGIFIALPLVLYLFWAEESRSSEGWLAKLRVRQSFSGIFPKTYYGHEQA